MRWAIGIAIGLLAVIGAVAAIGFFLPIKHEASRSAEFDKPPQVVFDLISDLPNYKQWWPENETKVVVVESVPPVRFVTRIVDETAFGGTWTMEIAPTSSGSRLTITERGEVYNVIFRTLSRFVFGYTGTMESFLAAAQRKVTTAN
jgi:hypothetical protein